MRVVQAGRVELDELHVRHATAGAPGHGNAVAGRGVGVAGVAVHLAHTAGGQHHRRSHQGLHAVGFDVQGVHAVTALRRTRLHRVLLQVALGDQVDRHPLLTQGDVGMTLDLVEQHIVDGLAGGIGRVGNAADRMAAFASQVQAQRPGRVGRERHTACNQPLNGFGTVACNELGGALVDQAAAGFLGVAHMGLDAVVAAQHADNATLGPGRGSFVHLALGQHDHGLRFCQVQGHRQTSQPRTDDDDRQGRFRHSRHSAHNGLGAEGERRFYAPRSGGLGSKTIHGVQRSAPQ